MYCSVHRPVNTPGVCDNKGSCKLLIEYLSKESYEPHKPYFDTFFSHDKDFVHGKEALEKIDNNKKTLKRNDDKFYMLTVNPSQHELRHLIRCVTGKKDIKNFSELSPEEQKDVISELKVYTRSCMDEYAKNFYREKIRDGRDLVWYGRVETERHYKGTDEAVKDGSASEGDAKPGLQLHVHIIVSRMDKSQTVSLSPLSNSRGNRQMLDGKEVIVGFDRSEWASRCAEEFNERYNYLPYYVNKERENEYRKWNENIYLKNMLLRKMKHDLLNGYLKNELMFLSMLLKSYRFVVNRERAFESGNYTYKVSTVKKERTR